MFSEHLISLICDIGWPVRSPHLASYDYFFWGYLKDNVCKHQTATIEELKDAVRLKVTEIPTEMTLGVIESFRNRLQDCMANRGHHLEIFTFKMK